MSSRSRLILLSGLGGSGTTTVAAATAEALRAEGLSVGVVDASGSVPVGVPADPGVVASLTATIGQVALEVGADRVTREAWTSAGVVAQMSALASVVHGLGENDAVVVDAGPLPRLRELIDLPAVLLRLLDAAMTPRVAMRRDAGGEPMLFEALSAARLDALRLQQALRHPATSVRLVMRPSADAVAPTARAVGVVGMLGVAVDGVVVNRFPRAKEGWPRRVVSEAASTLAAMRAAADGIEVWKSTRSVRPAPKGRSALGPLGKVRVLDAEQITVRVVDEEYRLDLALAGPARAEAAVGVQGDCVVVAFDGMLRWVPLPPVLRRCVPTIATRTAAGLSVAFVPDPDTWRAPAAEAS